LIKRLLTPEKTKSAKEIEFPLQFNLAGKKIDACCILLDSAPFLQCFVALETGISKNNRDGYQFFKVDEIERIFTWHPCSKEKEPVAKAIAGALEKKFSGTAIFSPN
jgi:hypothetical protein